MLDVYGPLFYAGVRTLERLLPLPEPRARHPVLVLRLRGRTQLGATMEDVLAHYVERLEAAGGRLYLTGLGERAYDEVVHMTKLTLSGPVRAYEVTPLLGESTERALADAQAWLLRKKPQSEGSGRTPGSELRFVQTRARGSSGNPA